ncbi:MAG: tetratricopeptide repeat protein [Candidatus Odinarchaeota archaeon]
MVDDHRGSEIVLNNPENIMVLEKLVKTAGNDGKIINMTKKIEEEALSSNNHAIAMKALGLAGNYFLRLAAPENLALAESYFSEALEIALNHDDPLVSKYYNKIGTVYLARNDSPAANNYFRKGLAHAEAKHDLKGEFFSLYFLGKNYLESRVEGFKDRNAAAKHFRKAFFTAKTLNDGRERLELMNMTLDRWIYALNWAEPEEVEKSSKLLESLVKEGSIFERNMIKEKLAGFNQQMGDFETAETIYKDLLADIDHHISGNRRNDRYFLNSRFYISNSLAFLYSNQGELQKAINIFRANSETAMGMKDTYQATFCRSNLAFVLTAKGELLEARKILEEIVNESKSSRDLRSRAYGLGGLGWLHGFTDAEKALSYYSQSIKVFERLDMPVPVKIVSSVAEILLKCEKTRKVASKTLKHYLDLLTHIQPENPEYSRVLIIEAKKLLARSGGSLDIEKAKDFLLRAYLHAQMFKYRELEVTSLLEMTRLEIDRDPPNIHGLKENLGNLVNIAEKDGIKHLLAETWLLQGLIELNQQNYASARVYFEKTGQLAENMQYGLIEKKCLAAINKLNILTKATDLYDQIDTGGSNESLDGVYDLEATLENAREYIRKVTIMAKQFQSQDRWKPGNF